MASAIKSLDKIIHIAHATNSPFHKLLVDWRDAHIRTVTSTYAIDYDVLNKEHSIDLEVHIKHALARHLGDELASKLNVLETRGPYEKLYTLTVTCILDSKGDSNE